MPAYLGGESPNVGRSSQSRRFDMATGIEESKVEATKAHRSSANNAHADQEESKEVPAPALAKEARGLRTEEEGLSECEYVTLKSLKELSYTKSKDLDDPKSSSIFVKSPLSSNSHNKSQKVMRLTKTEWRQAVRDLEA